MRIENAVFFSMTLAGLIGAFPVDAGAQFYDRFLTPPEAPISLQQTLAKERLRPKPGEFWMAIVGDSSVTGAAASPSYEASYFGLAGKIFLYLWESKRRTLVPKLSDYPHPERFNLSSPIEPLTRIVYSMAEFNEEAAKGEMARITLNAAAKAGLRLDTPELSFGYLVGRALRIPPAKIVLTGEDGKQVDSIARQFRRLAEIGTDELPPLVLMSYVANDFCNTDYFVRPVAGFRADYARSLEREFRQLLPMKANAQGTRIVFLAPLDVAQLLSSPAIRSQRVPFQGGGEVTCQAIREDQAASGPLGRAMEGTLSSECRGVLAKPDDPVAHIQRIRDLQEAQLGALTEAIDAFNRESRGIRIELARSTREIVYHAGDVANDCFHPAVRGHARVAEQLLTHELAGLLADRKATAAVGP